MIYITGDKHGKYGNVKNFCRLYDTSKEDVLIILGDAGINTDGEVYDAAKKELLQSLPVTFFCIHGNHENRPGNIGTYKEKLWHGGIVWYEEKYPDIFFAKDGEIYDFNGKKTIVIGGAYSVNKYDLCLYGGHWWKDEQPSDEIKQYVEQQLENADWKVDVVLSHTSPLKYRPKEALLDWVDQDSVDESTEMWLDSIEERLTYRKWYCGHYHIEKIDGRLEIMFNHFDEFCGVIGTPEQIKK